MPDHEKIVGIDIEGLARFGTGEQTRRLYFDGQLVHTDSVFTLTRSQFIFGLVIGLFSIAYNFVYILLALHIIGNSPTSVKVMNTVITHSDQPPFILPADLPPLERPQPQIMQCVTARPVVSPKSAALSPVPAGHLKPKHHPKVGDSKRACQ